MTNGGEFYKLLADWFQGQSSHLIPKEGMAYCPSQIEAYSCFFNRDAEASFFGFNLDGSRNYGASMFTGIHCDLVNAPLLAAIQCRLPHEKLVDIAKHHPVDVVSLIETLDAMIDESSPVHDINGRGIKLYELYKNCIKVVCEACPESLNEALQTHSSILLNLCSLQSEHPTHWPATRLRNHLKAMESGDTVLTALDEKNYCLTSWSSCHDYIPTNENGPQYDLFLERSGMLLPGVIGKKIGGLSLWEDFLESASRFNTISKLLDYCVSTPDERLKAFIKNGLKNLTLDSDDFYENGVQPYFTLCNMVKGTWLESLADDPKLLINLISDEPYEEAYVSWQIVKDPSKKPIEEFVNLIKNKGTLDYWLKEIMAVKPNELTLSHFKIFLLEQIDLPEQVITLPFSPEKIIKHMLAGLEQFTMPDAEKTEAKTLVDEQAYKGCVYLVKALSRRYELDYTALNGIGSLGIRALAEAGLDKRRLPKMNYRDKGILVSAELGL
jgi:hypothetical protein